MGAEITVHFFVSPTNDEAAAGLGGVHYEWMENKDLLRPGEWAKQWQGEIIQQQQIHTSKKKQ